MTPIDVLILITLLLFKHLVVDFPMQVPYHYKNKGTYGHMGGIQHASLHGMGTLFILMAYATPITAALLALADMVAHYHIDWAKMNLNKHFNWKPDNAEQFWWLIGLDQFLHQLTYLAITWYLL